MSEKIKATHLQDFRFSNNKKLADVLSGTVLHLDCAAKFIGDNCHPADIFTREDLAEWARDNGFVKAEVKPSFREEND